MNYLFISIIIFVLLIIYGILFRMKNNQIINTIESFETNLRNINEININMMKFFLNGHWTSNTSTHIGENQVSNTILFKMENNSKGVMIYKGLTFDIKNVGPTGIFSTNKVNGMMYEFNPNPNYEEYRLPTDAPNQVPMLEMIPKGSSNVDKTKALIFKYVGEGLLHPKVIEMVKYKFIYPIIDGYLYSMPSINNISNYKFDNDILEPIYEDLNKIISPSNMKQFKEKIVKYNNLATFQILREFYFSNSEQMFTPFSQLYNFQIIKGNKVFYKLKLKKSKNELAHNNLLDKFYNINTFIYLHKIDKHSINYDFSEPPIQFSKNDLKLKNSAEKYFETSLYAPNITSARKTSTSNFKPFLIGMLNNFDKNDIEKGINTDDYINCLNSL